MHDSLVDPGTIRDIYKIQREKPQCQNNRVQSNIFGGLRVAEDWLCTNMRIR